MQKGEAMQMQLMEEISRRAADAENHHDLRKANDDYVEAMDAHKLRADTFAAELDVAKDALSEHVMDFQMLQSKCDTLATEIEVERQNHAFAADGHSETRAECERIAQDLKTRTEAHNTALRDLEGVSNKHSGERRRADELQEQLNSASSVHEDLFTKLSAAVAEVDTLRHDYRTLALERDSLRDSLAETRRAKEELEEAEPPGPSQLSVSDVLISIVFDGNQALPLEVLPWDTNFEDVVVKWLAAANKSSQLRVSLTRYLQQLEDTTDVFPVRLEAKLVDIHEAFALYPNS